MGKYRYVRVCKKCGKVYPDGIGLVCEKCGSILVSNGKLTNNIKIAVARKRLFRGWEVKDDDN